MTDSFARVRMEEACRQDILFYINTFCYIYEPRKMKTFPWVTWKFQDDAILTILDCIEQGNDLVITKSRDMGVSWICVAVMAWMWHFKKNTNSLMVSRKEDLVDRPGDPDSLFWKIDFLLKYQPDWLKPSYDRRRMHFGNDNLNSTIDGESTNAGAGVGGRRTCMFIDEFSRIDQAQELMAGTADTTDCRIFNFTYYGLKHPSYALGKRGDVRQLKLKWDLHPEKSRGLYRWNDKNKIVDVLDTGYEYPADFKFVMDGKIRSPWYDNECVRRANAREVAMMIDMDPEGYGGQVFEEDMILELSNAYGCEPYWEGDIRYDADTGEPSGLVEMSGGPLKLWCNPDVEGKVPQYKYGAGADISQGTGATPSAMMIGNAETGEKVAEFVTNTMRPEAFAQKCVALCRLFCDKNGVGARFAWELHGPGIPFGEEVIRLGYTNHFHRVADVRNRLTGTVGTRPGWSPTPDNKRLLLEQYRTALSTRQLLNRSRPALQETLDFSFNDRGVPEHKEFNNDDPTGTGPNHGDRVIADGLMWMMMQSLGIGRRLVEMKKNELPTGEVPYRSIAWFHQQERTKDILRRREWA